MNNLALDNPLWQFACHTYGQAGIADALLELQDLHGLNINILLLLTWLGQQGIAINRLQLQEYLDTIGGLEHDIIQPLRKVRRAIKTYAGLPDNHYQCIKKLELAFEQEAIARLYRQSLAINVPRLETSCAEGNLKRYALADTQDVNSLLAVLLTSIG